MKRYTYEPVYDHAHRVPQRYDILGPNREVLAYCESWHTVEKIVEALNAKEARRHGR